MVSHPGEGLERKGICRATHGDEQGRIVCKLLSQLLRCSGAEINANLLHNGKDFWMYAHSWLGACRTEQDCVIRSRSGFDQVRVAEAIRTPRAQNPQFAPE